MPSTAIILIVVLVVVFVPVLWFFATYNGFVRLRNQAKNAWAQIDVQLKRRHDLIPNLVETVKGYTKHERETLEAVVAARGAALSANGVSEKIKAEGELSGALSRLLAVAENYPDLKANQNYAQLQEELSSTENRIAFARQAYNDQVMRYNTRREVIPASIVANMCNFAAMDLFEIADSAQREVPQVKF